MRASSLFATLSSLGPSDLLARPLAIRRTIERQRRWGSSKQEVLSVRAGRRREGWKGTDETICGGEYLCLTDGLAILLDCQK